MSTDENKAVIRRFWEAVNQGDPKAIEDTLAASYKARVPGQPDLDADGMSRLVMQYRSAFPDLHVTIEEMLAEGEKVATRVSMTGTHSGQFEGIAPTGKQVQMAGMQIDRVLYGRSVRMWANFDVLSLVQQLGGAPAPAAAGA
jgi:steroid delta-isomerase-like uncharacterized protein